MYYLEPKHWEKWKNILKFTTWKERSSEIFKMGGHFLLVPCPKKGMFTSFHLSCFICQILWFYWIEETRREVLQLPCNLHTCMFHEFACIVEVESVTNVSPSNLSLFSPPCLHHGLSMWLHHTLVFFQLVVYSVKLWLTWR